MITHGSLYSGIGGWLLAAKATGINNIFTCEIDEFCNKVLDKHFPDTDRHHDIKEFKGEKYRGAVDIISTSDPCQPFSFAGKRGGTTDDRYLWPQTIRAIREIKPAIIVFENVANFVNMAFEIVASDLENEGYTIESFIIPACAIGAWHRRNRLWIIAYTGHPKPQGWILDPEGQQPGGGGETRSESTSLHKNFSNTNSKGLSITTCKRIGSIQEQEKALTWGADSRTITEGWDYWSTEPDVDRVADGVPDRVDRIKSLGNAIVPQIAYIIFQTIITLFYKDKYKKA